VLFKNDIGDVDWTILGDHLPGTGAPMTVEDLGAPMEARRFYRVQVAD
jgi:hypothetical protein